MRKQQFLKLTTLLVALLLAISTTALAEDMMKDDDMPMMGMTTDAGYIDVTPEEALQLIMDTPDLVIIDVSPKYAEGHLPGALHYYIGDGSLENAIPMLDMDKPYLVYCHVDAASIPGATALVEAGFSPVYRLLGNYPAWVEAGYEVSTLTMDEEIAMMDKAMTDGHMMMDTDKMGMMTEAGYIDLTPAEAMMLIETTPDLVIIDVSPKYDEGHLPGAMHYYLGDDSLDAAIPMLDMNVPYLVYCHVDSVSIAGATKLVEAGFSPVYRLLGNYPAWVEAGFPVE